MRTKVAIIGSGPSGLLLGQLLGNIGVDNVIVDRSGKGHILSRVRAGVLEEGTTGLLEAAGVGSRLQAGACHTTVSLSLSMVATIVSIFQGGLAASASSFMGKPM